MQATPTLLLTFALLATAFAGCTGEDPVLNAAFVATPTDAAQSSFRFDASSSTGKGLQYSWNFGDRTEAASGKIVEHTYQYPNGKYQVTLTVTDEKGATKKITQPVTTGNGVNEAPLLYLSVDKRRATPSDEIIFDASQSVDPDGDPIFFAWDFNAEIDEQTLNKMENLGGQAYGRFPEGKPAPGSTANGTDNSTGSESTASTSAGPSPDLQVMIEEARKRFYERMGWEQLHGGEPGAAEPRNEEFDGKINDTNPIVVFQFPANAVYYVHVRVEDIKGEGQEGFIKISIEDSVPASSNATILKAELKPAPFSPVGGQVPQASAYAVFPFKYDYPAKSTLTLTYTVNPSAGDASVAAYVCAAGSSFSVSNCKTQNLAKLDAGASGRTLTWVVGPGESLPFTYNVLIENVGNSVVNINAPVGSAFDLNPWAKDEAGFGGAHH